MERRQTKERLGVNFFDYALVLSAEVWPFLYRPKVGSRIYCTLSQLMKRHHEVENWRENIEN